MKASSLFLAAAAYVIALPALAAAPMVSQITFGLTTTPQTATLTGSGFLSTTTVKLSNSTTNLIVASVSSTSLKANLPAGLAAGVYTLTAANGSSSVAWYVTYGATGPTGAAATVAVGTTTTGAAGTNASVTNSGTSAATVLNFTVPRGATGVTGATGNQGPQGNPGATGGIGPMGPAGGVGPQGPVGPAGSLGPAGPTGATGTQGVQGAKGDAGPQGPTGADGLQGLPGTGVYANNRNTAAGEQALQNKTGLDNTAFGFQALLSTEWDGSSGEGLGNTAIGSWALTGNTRGYNNTAVGQQALKNNTTAWGNAAFGPVALFSNTTGSANVAYGVGALGANTTGSMNIGLGTGAGQFLANGSYNIEIGNQGLAGDDHLIRIGDNNQNRAFIAGINGNDLSATGLPVVVTPSGQLGTGALLVGPVGPAGPAGPAGAPGSVGPAGANGSAGPAGAAGTNGSPGANGAQGPKGDAGPQGPQGLEGLVGAPGVGRSYVINHSAMPFDGSTLPRLPSGGYLFFARVTTVVNAVTVQVLDRTNVYGIQTPVPGGYTQGVVRLSGIIQSPEAGLDIQCPYSSGPCDDKQLILIPISNTEIH